MELRCWHGTLLTEQDNGRVPVARYAQRRPWTTVPYAGAAHFDGKIGGLDGSLGGKGSRQSAPPDSTKV